MTPDVIVIGAGAAGIFAATAAAEAGAATLLLEKNRRAGVKILASGGTRCNVAPDLDIEAIGPWFGVQGERFLRHGLHRLGAQDIRDRLREEGVETVSEEFEKIFPKSGQASDVLEAFLRRLSRSGAVLRCEAGVTDVHLKNGSFEVTIGSETTTVDRVIVTVGGCSYSKTGTTGDGYPWLRRLGHTIVEPTPALVPLIVEESFITGLAGVTITDCRVKVVSSEGKRLLDRRRPVLFTHRGLSGPGAMDASSHLAGESTRLVIDWMPGLDEEWLEDTLRQTAGDRSVRETLARFVPRRFATTLIERAGGTDVLRHGDLRREVRRALVDIVKRDDVPVAGNEGFDRAEVTRGGISLKEVDRKTMESRLVPNLYIAGEILDLDGPIGGFNFMSAFATGLLAGEAAAR